MTTPAMQWATRMSAIDALFWALDVVPELRSTTGALVMMLVV